MASNIVKMWNYWEYYPEYTRDNLSPDEIRKEYSRLRVIADRRLKALQRAGYGDTQQYLTNTGKFKAASKVRDVDLPYALYQVSRFIASKISTPTGIKRMEKNAIATLHEHGYTFVNKGNIKEFGKYMEWTRSIGLSGILSSERAAELFSEHSVAEVKKVYAATQKRLIDPTEVLKNFETYQENLTRLHHLSIARAAKMTSDEILEYLEKPKRKSKKR